MGMLVDGLWTTENAGVVDPKGNFVRRDGQFRNWITADGSSPFSAEAGRYHLYVSAACPWAHRTLILRGLKKLDDIVSLSIVDPLMTDDGWHFSDGDGCVPDTVNGCDLMRDVYLKADPAVTTQVTVPVLWDKQQQTIVSNESSEIIRMFGTAFDAIGAVPHDYYPEGLQADIDRTNDIVYAKVNNGVYRTALSISPTSRATCAISTNRRVWPKPSTWTISRDIISVVTRASIRVASFPVARTSISPRHMIVVASSRRSVTIKKD